MGLGLLKGLRLSVQRGTGFDLSEWLLKEEVLSCILCENKRVA